MLLRDVDFNSHTKIKKIDKFLKENFGIVLSQNASKSELQAVRKTVCENIRLLKVENGLTPKDSEMAKSLLILEGVDLMISKCALNERAVQGPYSKVIGWLSDFVAKNIELGDDLDEAIAEAMKHYRSSKYRFPDVEIEYAVRERVAQEIPNIEAKYAPRKPSPEEIRSAYLMDSTNDGEM